MGDESGKVEREKLPLSRAAQYLLEECRTVLPGIQTLFGFQLIVVFQPGFSQKLTEGEQRLHLLAIALLALAIALIMAPAAFHRQSGTQEVTSTFVRLASRLLLASMVPLAVGICIEFYLVGHVIYPGPVVPVMAAALFTTIVILWFVLPRAIRR